MPPRDRAARAVLQRLESLQRAGVSHVPKVAAARRDAAADNAAAGNAAAENAAAKDAAAKEDDVKRKAGREETSRRAIEKESQAIKPEPAESPSAEPVAATPEPGIASPADVRAADDRVAELEAVRRRVVRCKRCAELASTRTQTVFGVGNPRARLVFLGEAPGADEDAQGEPFVGRAGQLLTKIIEACTLRREDVYILNVLKCRPPNNRNPEPDEAANCREYLDAQLAIIQPENICCLGAVAAKNLLETEASIGKMRGKFYLYNGIKVLCTYHPAYLLRNPSAKRQVWEDMQFLMAEMGIKLPAAGSRET